MAKNKSDWRANVGLLAAALVGWVSGPSADVGPVFQISDGTTTVPVVDNAAEDSNPLVGGPEELTRRWLPPTGRDTPYAT
jgi:hypothetical protein